MTKLSDVSNLIVDCEHKTAPIQQVGYPSIRTPNIGRGRLILDNVNRVSEDTYKAWTRRAEPQEGDLILAREAPIGNVAIIPKNLKVCLGQRTVLIRANKNLVLPGYLVYLLLGDELQSKIFGMANGATVHHLNMEDIRNLELPTLPPIIIQQRISSILSAYDDLIENNTRRIRILEEMAQAIYRQWFVHFRFPGHEGVKMVESPVGMIPEGWEVKSLGDIAEEVRRNVHPNQVAPETPYVGLEHIPRKSFALLDWGEARDVQSAKLVFLENEILFGKIRPYFHKVVLAPIKGVCSTDTIVIRPRDPIYLALVLSVVFSEEFVAHATQTSQGTKMPRANWDILVKYNVLIPGQELLCQFNDTVDNIMGLVHNLTTRNRNLRQQRDLLLPRLVSGELDIGDLEISPVLEAEEP